MPSQAKITLVWIPSHVGIPGNEKVDELAKLALEKKLPDSNSVIWSDLKPRVNRYTMHSWQAEWNLEVENKLHEIQPILGEKVGNLERLNQRQESVLTRLHIGHSRITHEYLLKEEERPQCVACDIPFTVKHFLVECSDFLPMRRKYYTTTDLYTLF
ncbi:ribonuclease HI [Elysia marginata]|uniref:Ribonuclease HI n=1 Tax=Elysia marginata TaxID=1093978 RepID=A0AAV4GSW5_9GAST|nr:ribonuclease HI [Elysia marginata]